MSRRPRLWELISCGFNGHCHVGIGAAQVVEDDALYVREIDGVRWHRCLRCDGWHHFAPPVHPTSERVPSRDEISLPLRGPQLRDRYVLRLIAIDRAIHVLFLVGIAVAIFIFVGHRHSLERSYDQIMNSLLGSSGGPAALRGVLGKFHKVFVFAPAHLYELGIAATFYAALEATEMVGLWFAKRWAEYLTFIATILLLPLEVDELISGFSPFKITILILNVAVAVYLLLAKRLFGARGGRAVEEQRRNEASGWGAIERATPSPAGDFSG